METLKLYFWQALTIIEFLVILWFITRWLISKKKQLPERQEILKSKESIVDMEDLMKDIYLSEALFRELSRKCHPDRFAGSDLENRANELFKLIQTNKSNYRELEVLKESAIIELNIKLS
jgi:hypothetical protein